MEVIEEKESGFKLPENYTWDAKLENGKWKKEGKVIVKDEKGRVFRVLQFKNDQLNGLCEFYDRGRLKEKRMFLNDKEEGWGCEIIQGSVTKWFLYSGGVRIVEFEQVDDMKDYWYEVRKTSDSNTRTLSICKNDDNHKATGKGYVYDNDSEQTTISRVVLFENGVESVTLKSFDGNRMIEYDNNGNLVYEGGYADSIANDYPRDGDGIEYDEGEIAYEGVFVNGKREGKGCSYKDGFVYYEGEWKEGQPDGEGWLSVNGMLVYYGNWKEGKKEGQGRFFKNGNLCFEGEWKQDKPNGKGSSFNSEGELVIEGEWNNGYLNVGNGWWYDSESGVIEFVNMEISNENELRLLVKNEDMKKRLNKLVIKQNCGVNMCDRIEICDFLVLESIYVEKNSVRYLSYLRIANNPRLKTISTENGVGWDGNTCRAAFERVTTAVIESMMIDD